MTDNLAPRSLLLITIVNRLATILSGLFLNILLFLLSYLLIIIL
jgi:hypothetical protein